jgi:transcriptional regulator with XRE-family HTH domain
MSPEEVRAVRGQLEEADFALLIGVSPSTVWRWERGGIPPQGSSLTLLELMRDHRRETLRLLWQRLKPRMDGLARSHRKQNRGTREQRITK